VAHLTGLTCLQLCTASNKALLPSPELCAAIQKLQHLVNFAPMKVSVDVLPALVACTRLTGIQGIWCSGTDADFVVSACHLWSTSASQEVPCLSVHFQT
jgi:hypothetical protein